MKILLVITKSEIGGATVFVLNMAQGLKSIGYSVEVAAGDGDYLFEELRKENIPFHYLKSLKRDFSLLNSLYFIYDLYILLKDNKYDMIHLNSSNALIGSLASFFFIKKVKTTFTFHGLSFIDKNYRANRLFKLLAKFYYKVLLKTIDKVIFECNLNYEEVKKANMVDKAEVIFNGINSDNLNFLPHKVVVDFFSERSKVDLSNSFLIGSTGRLIYQKNYEFLIDNFILIKQRIPNAKVIIIGDGPDFTSYHSKINELGIQNDFLLLGELKDSHKYMRGFDVFTLVSRYEGVSISLIEALFAEIPILVSNVGGNKDVVGECEKELFTLNNFQDFLNKLLQIKENNSFYISQNISMQQRFKLPNMIEKYDQLFKDISQY